MTDVAKDELVSRETQRLAPLKAQVQAAQAERERAVRGWLAAIVAALVVLAVAEPLIMPPARVGERVAVPPALAGLVTARYALLALWVAVVVAKPSILTGLPWLLAVLLVVVAAAAAVAPLGRRTAANP